MDGDLGAMLQSVLSDPEQMAKLTQAAQGLLGGAPPDLPAASEPVSAAPQVPGFSAGEAKLLSALGRSFGGAGGGPPTALLTAMRPYLKPEKQAKLDRAMKLTRMVRIAQSVMQELGGRGV